MSTVALFQDLDLRSLRLEDAATWWRMHQQILLKVEVLFGFCKQDPNGTPATSVLAKVLATRISQWHIEPEYIQNIL